MEKVRVVQSSQNSSPEISPNSSCTSDIHASTSSGMASPCRQTACSILSRQSGKLDTLPPTFLGWAPLAPRSSLYHDAAAGGRAP